MWWAGGGKGGGGLWRWFEVYHVDLERLEVSEGTVTDGRGGVDGKSPRRGRGGGGKWGGARGRVGGWVGEGIE